MILVNDKELDLSVPEEDKDRFEKLTYNEQWAIKKIAEILPLKEVRIIDPRKLDKRQLAFKPRQGFDVSGRVRNPKTGITEHWRHSNTPPTLIKDNKVYNTRHYEFFASATLFPDPDAELIFFLLNVVDLKKRKYVIENKEAEAKKKNDMRKNKSHVEYWIFTKSTPEDIKKLAYRWGIEVGEKSDSELRDELMSLLEANENLADAKRGYSAFIKEMESDSDIVRVGSYFMNEFSNKRISLDPSNRKFLWSGTTQVIGGTIPPARMADAAEYMIQYLIDNPAEKQLFLEAVTDDKVIELNDDYTLITHPAKLRAWAKKKYEFDILMVSLPEGQKKIKEYIEKLKVEEPVTE